MSQDHKTQVGQPMPWGRPSYTVDYAFGNGDSRGPIENKFDKDGRSLWQRPHATSDCDITVQSQARLIFIERYGSDETLTIKKEYTLNLTVFEVLDAVYGKMKERHTVSPYERDVIVTGLVDGKPVFLEIYINDSQNSPVPRRGGKVRLKGVTEYSFTVTADRDQVTALFEHLDEVFSTQHFSVLKWWYQSGHGPETRSLNLPPLKTKLLPEFYPDLSDPSQFIRDYLEADESVLMLAGPPGTGKTTLLRHLICDNKLSAHVIYDEKLMQSDNVFQNFLFDATADILIVEDADTILSSREDDGNKLMSRFLNVSDGLIKLPNKKVVFTTNINDFSRVDPALLRPGRCYGVVHTRALNLPEAQAAARVANLPVPVSKGEYTLAELFNQGRGGMSTIRRIGFTGR